MAASTFFHAASLVFLASFTSPPWPSQDYHGGRNKDARAWQTYSSIVERAVALGVGYNPNPPSFFQSERRNLTDAKAWIVSRSSNFVDISKSDGGDFDTWFSTPTITTNEFYGYTSTNYPQDFPMLTVSSIVAAVGCPTNYFSYTPWQQLNGSGQAITNAITQYGFSELDYGWKYIPQIIGLMKAVKVQAAWSQRPSSIRWHWSYWQFAGYSGYWCPLPSITELPPRGGGISSFEGPAWASFAYGPTDPTGTVGALSVSGPTGTVEMRLYLKSESTALENIPTPPVSPITGRPCGEDGKFLHSPPTGLSKDHPLEVKVSSGDILIYTMSPLLDFDPPDYPRPGDELVTRAEPDTGPGGAAITMKNASGWKAGDPLVYAVIGFEY